MDKIHITCLNILNDCPECKKEISGVVKANIGFPAAIQMSGAITSALSSAYLHVGYAYFEILDTMIRNAKSMNKTPITE